MRKYNRPSKDVITRPVNLENKIVDKYVQKHFPQFSWYWATVDNEGMPLVLLTRFENNRMKEWKLLRQKDIN